MRRAALASLVMLTACGSTQVESLQIAVSADSTCGIDIIGQIDDVSVELRTPRKTFPAACRVHPASEDDFDSLEEMKSWLKTLTFEGFDQPLKEGKHELKLLAYDSRCPNTDKIIGCAHLTFELPVDDATLPLAMVCYHKDVSSSVPPAFTDCLAR